MHDEPMSHERVPGAHEEWRYDLVNNPRAVPRLWDQEAALNTMRGHESSSGGDWAPPPDQTLTPAEIAQREKSRREYFAGGGVFAMRRSVLRHYLVDLALDSAEAFQRLVDAEQAWVAANASTDDPARQDYLAFIKRCPLENYGVEGVLSTGGGVWYERVCKDAKKARAARARRLEAAGAPTVMPGRPQSTKEPQSDRKVTAAHGRPAAHTPKKRHPLFVTLVAGIVGLAVIIWAVRWLLFT